MIKNPFIPVAMKDRLLMEIFALQIVQMKNPFFIYFIMEMIKCLNALIIVKKMVC